MTTTAINIVQGAGISTENLLANNLVERFIRFAGVAEKSASTYKTSLNQLNKYFVANGITQPTRADLEMWRDNLIADGKSPSTVQLYLCSSKIFFRWLSQEGLYPNIADNLKSRVKVNREHKKDALSSNDLRMITAFISGRSPKGRQNILVERRDRALFALMSTAGLRCIEIARAVVGDLISVAGRHYMLVQGKGHCQKDARILVPRQVLDAIKDYLALRGKTSKSEPLFVSESNRTRGKGLSSQSISKILKSHFRRAGYDSPRLTAHSLRHSAACAMLESGCDLLAVKMVLRHTDVSTTTIYVNHLNRLKNTAEQSAADFIFGKGVNYCGETEIFGN